MRLWSLHPRYLDPQGLVALWREALLAKAVLRGDTRGYRHHPQLERFRYHSQPLAAINAYLLAVHAEALSRGYAFDGSKLGRTRDAQRLPVSSGQLAVEWQHLLGKLARRSPATFARCAGVTVPLCHPLFRRRAGPAASWERRSGL
ncbi:MAG: pyrimidine dimer DNA glycosylase/endonuclease V [Gammaproteobacteria bacterium]